MAPIVLSPRKPDALDTWNALYYKRYEAYCNNDFGAFKSLNQELKEIRRKGGWNEAEIAEEFGVYDALLYKLYTPPPGNGRISYDINDMGQPQHLSLTILQISTYWRYRGEGKSHCQALSWIV